MAKNDSVRLKAQQMREQQAQADRRTRNIIIAIVSVVVIAIIATVGIVIGQQINKRAQVLDLSSQSGEAAVAAANELLGDYANGAPVVLTRGGVGQADASLPTVTEYFDYSCHACADVDGLIGRSLSEDAVNGKYNIELQPVTTVGMAYSAPATSASLIVAQKAPDKWVDFHHALLAYFQSQYRAGNGQVIRDAEASWKQVQSIAAELGIAQDVIDTFPLDATANYLKASTEAWGSASYEGRVPGRLGTPEFIKDKSSVISLTGNDAATLLASLRQGLGVAE